MRTIPCLFVLACLAACSGAPGNHQSDDAQIRNDAAAIKAETDNSVSQAIADIDAESNAASPAPQAANAQQPAPSDVSASGSSTPR